MRTSDGTRLDADLYRPAVAGSFPVLLMRQPYGRAIASTVVYAHPSWYAAHGYIVVIQDVRGRGTSAGSFIPFAHERQDGGETVTWAASLPGSTGQVGMYGFSYQGMTQLYAASTHPSALQTICPAMMAYDLYADMAYENGAFCLQSKLGWAIQLEAESARLRGDVAAHQALVAAALNLPLFDRVPARPEVLSRYAPDSFYFEWLDHPYPDAYWNALSPHSVSAEVDLPTLHIGGWFDPYLRGSLRFYKAMAARSPYPQHLIVGPWVHIPWGRQAGSVDFGPEAISPIDRLQIRWFDQMLKGIDTGLLRQDPVRLFEMGSNQWRCFPVWPQFHPHSVYLCSSGLAGMSEREGSLVELLPEADSEDVLVHDPWRPVPSLGGHAAVPAGSFDRSAVDHRSDVLTYTTEPLQQDLPLAGDLIVEVYCVSQAVSFDLCATLSEVSPQGVYNFSQGYVRVDPGQAISPLRIPLQPTCVRIAQGRALRLSLSAACFPAYPVNPGTGSQPSTAPLIEAQIITVQVQCGGLQGSRILLPVSTPSPAC
jgi:hypothetical protein